MSTLTEFDSLPELDLPEMEWPVDQLYDVEQTSLVESSDEIAKAARLLIVDKEATKLNTLHGHLQSEGYVNFVTSTDCSQVMRLIRRHEPDVVLMDVILPEIDGFVILKELRATTNFKHLPVMVLTESTEADTRRRALQCGASDFLTDPIDLDDLTLRLRNVLLAKIYRDQLTEHAENLELEVRRRTAELDASREEVILCLARAGEYRDNDTGNHVIRVGKYVGIIAREMGFSLERVDIIEQAARLHDVGKIAIPDELLKRPGKLTHDEFELMKKHCLFGRDIMQPLPPAEWERFKKHTELGARMLDAASSPVLALAALIALTHHEWWDGSGYPLGLAGEDIPIEGRMTAIADVFDALSTKRPYKAAIPRHRCFKMMEEDRGTHFDPRLLEAFFRRQDEIIQVQLHYAGHGD